MPCLPAPIQRRNALQDENEYVTDAIAGKFSAQMDYLSNEVNAASSTAERNRLQKQLDALRKKQVELAAFDDLLRHYADQRISP